MKISNSLIAILNSRGFCVDELSDNCPYWGTTYQFSRGGIEKPGFSVIVESGDSLDELINHLIEKKGDYENGTDFIDFMDESSVLYCISSLEEIIGLVELWNQVRCAYA